MALAAFVFGARPKQHKTQAIWSLRPYFVAFKGVDREVRSVIVVHSRLHRLSCNNDGTRVGRASRALDRLVFCEAGMTIASALLAALFVLLVICAAGGAAIGIVVIGSIAVNWWRGRRTRGLA